MQNIESVTKEEASKFAKDLFDKGSDCHPDMTIIGALGKLSNASRMKGKHLK